MPEDGGERDRRGDDPDEETRASNAAAPPHPGPGPEHGTPLDPEEGPVPGRDPEAEPGVEAETAPDWLKPGTVETATETTVDGPPGPMPAGAGAGVGAAASGPTRTHRERHRDEIREQYGRLRYELKRREDRFEDHRRRLAQARVPTTWDVYLARVLRRAGIAAGAGALLGLGLAIVGVTRADLPALLLVGLPLVLGILSGAGAGAAGYYWPILQARRRRFRIEQLLPHGIAYLYALTQGGFDAMEAMRALADVPDDYGELAREFDAIDREMAYLGADPLTALRAGRDRTPSPTLASFLDDLAATIDAGGDVAEFLAAETESTFERTSREQRRFLEQVGLYAELYVGILVVGPSFAIIVFTLLSLAGSGAFTLLALTAYALVPLATVAFLALLWNLTRPYETDDERNTDGDESNGAVPEPTDDPRLAVYRHEGFEEQVREILAEPLVWLRQRPVRSLLATVPLALVVLLLVLVAGLAEPTLAAMTDGPIRTTVLLFVLPAAIVAVPYTLLYEFRTFRERAIAQRFPDLLEQLSGANEQGLTLAEAFAVVARRTEGPLGEELRGTANDLQWGAGLAEALDRFRRRIQLPTVGRTVALLRDASHYSGNLHSVLDVAARGTANAAALEEDRRNEASTYITIVLLSFGLYLFMLLVVQEFFLERVADLPPVEYPEGVSAPDFVATIDAGKFRTVLFHAALIQGTAAGLIAGELGAESWRNGLKYALLLVTVTVLAFAFVPL